MSDFISNIDPIYINYLLLALSVGLMIFGLLGVVNRKLFMGQSVGIGKNGRKNKIMLFGWSKKTHTRSGVKQEVKNGKLMLHGIPAMVIGAVFVVSGVLSLMIATEAISANVPLKELPAAEIMMSVIALIVGISIARYQRLKNKFYEVVNDKEIQKKMLEKIAETQEMMDEEQKTK